MRVSQVGSLTILGAEGAHRANTIRVTLHLRDVPDTARIAQAYERQVRARAPLRQRFVEDPRGHRYVWEDLEQDTLDAFLQAERRALAVLVDEQQLDAFQATNSCLPFRLRRQGERTLVALVSHVLTNPQGALNWVEDFLGFYRAGTRDDPQLPPVILRDRKHPDRRPLRRLRNALSCLGWALRFRLQNVAVGRRTVDLTDGRPLEVGDAGHSTWRHVFDDVQTRRILRGRQSYGQPLTAQLLVALGRTLLAARPDCSRAHVAVAADLVPWMVGFARVQAGNPLGYQLARMRRGRSLLREAHLVIRWRRRGLPYHLPRLANFLKRNQVALVKRIAQRATRPMKLRGPLSNFSATLANLGSHREHRRLEDMCDWASITLPGPVPTLTALQVRGCLAIELCYPTDLCDPEALLRLTADLPAALEAGPSAS